MPSNHRSTLTNLSRNFDTSECKLIFDSQHNGTNDNRVNNLKKSKKAVMNEREVAYRNEDACNSFTFMTIVIIIPYVLTMYLVDYQLYQLLFVLR